jgi:uncharacterized protein (DUF362 family)
MENPKPERGRTMSSSRRQFIQSLGTAAAGLVLAPYVRPGNVLAYEHHLTPASPARVSITQTAGTAADAYDPADVRQKIQYLFEQLGGISDVVKAGDKVALKINLTGGSGNATSPMLKGVPITEAMWTHPAVLQAVGELLIDAGVRPGDLTIVDALWDTGTTAPFGSNDGFGYAAVQKALGCNVVNLNSPAPYAAFASMSTGSSPFNFASLTMNQILQDVAVYVSIPKLKHHAEASLTCSLKNQVGAVPKSLYTIPTNTGRRQALHHPTGGGSNDYLPKSICDLNVARPVTLAVVDGIRNAKGGEGVWNSTFVPYRSQVLFAGKDPVATDSVGAFLMGLDCEAPSIPLPDGVSSCTNYLALLHAKGIGTNQLSEIDVVGDGAGLISSVRPETGVQRPTGFLLLPNFPNPFNPSTRIVFYAPKAGHVTVKVFTSAGAEIQTLVRGEVPAGQHDLYWSAEGLASGVYLCRMEAEQFSHTIRMIYVK